MVQLSNICNAASRPKLWGGFFIQILLTLAFVLSLCSVAPADEESTAPAPAMPDVLVFIVSVMEPYDHISINYTASVPEDQVKKDLEEIISETDWKLSEVEITTASAGTPGAKPITQVSFRTARIADTAGGHLPLAPFVTALKRFESVEVHYVMPSGFLFQGLKNFENKYVNVLMSQVGNAYKYRVRIKDSSFGRIQLPLRQPAEPKAALPGGAPAGARFMLIGGIALIGAVLAYILTHYLSNRRRIG